MVLKSSASASAADSIAKVAMIVFREFTRRILSFCSSRRNHKVLPRVGRDSCTLYGSRRFVIESQNWFKFCAFASRAFASGFQRNSLREMLYIPACFARPSHRTFLLGDSDTP